MGSKSNCPGFYEFLIEAELQQYFSAFKNELKIQNVAQFKYVTEEDMSQIGMTRPEIRRLTKYFNKHCPQTYLAKMKKKLLYRKDDCLGSGSLGSGNLLIPGRTIRSVAPGRHIIQADAIVSHKTLGSGEFGTVQQGVWTSDDGPIQVAIKCLSQERMENNPVEFLKEAAIMHTVDHEHIVRLYGVVLDTSSLVLVTELAPLRSLLECLKESSMRPNLTVQTLFDFSIQICDGMEYLESKRLIHRDLAARNILVFSRSKVKISDFGLSRALGVGKDYYQTNFNVNLKLPIAWCAPECINFLRFTSASDVWAYGVTLWEMFSYGFQPWAALTGQQILEGIDEPNYQRLERPDCCPAEIYCQILLKCWQHEPQNRPTFAQLLNFLPECKPEQLQAIRESDTRSGGSGNKRDNLSFDAGDLITVIDKNPINISGSNGNLGRDTDDASNIHWKGALKCGKTGLFNPAHTIAYLGPSLPSVKESNGVGPFNRNDTRTASIRKGRLSADMISSPQGDLKHTGHVGPDGQFFGDITFMNSKCWVPRQVVPPYKPESPIPPADTSTGNSNCSGSRFPFLGKGCGDIASELLSFDKAPLLSHKNPETSVTSQQRNRKKLVLPSNGSVAATNDKSISYLMDSELDHEYHEISDEENEIMASSRASGKSKAEGVTNPALSSRSQSPLGSPRFEKTFSLGPSLMDEVFGALEREQNTRDAEDEANNVKNELREMIRRKKKFATVKPISSKDRKTLDQAIAIANELASRSMLELDRHGKSGRNSNSFDDISSPRTPTTPTHRKKFSFILGSAKHNGSERERRNYSQEAASIPDIQSTLTAEAKEAYNSLIDKPSSIGSLGFLTPSFENKSSSFHFPEKCCSKKSTFFDTEPLSPPPNSSFNSQSVVAACSSTGSNTTNSQGPNVNSVSTPSSSNTALSRPGFVASHIKSLSCTAADLALSHTRAVEDDADEPDGNPLRLLRQNKVPNVLPLPPRDRRRFQSSRSFDGTTTATKPATVMAAPVTTNNSQNLCGSIFANGPSRHQRKHPLLIPGKISLPTELTDPEVVKFTPPPPPPKPQRHRIPSPSLITHKHISQSETVSVVQTDEELQKSKEIGLYTTKPDPPPPMSPRRDDNNSKLELIPFYENYEDDGVYEQTKTDSQSISECTPNLLVSKSEASPLMTPQHRRDPIEIRDDREDPSPSSSNLSSKLSDVAGANSEQSIIERVDGAEMFAGKVVESGSSSMSLGNPHKVKTVQRILGSSTSEKDCIWALDICHEDCAHAVKLLRLKCLLPDSLLLEDIERVISVLDMSHWDVARSADFLLSTSNQLSRNRPSIRKFQLDQDDNEENSPRSISVGGNNNGVHSQIFLDDITNSNTNRSNGTDSQSTTTGTSITSPSYIRPTRV